MNNFLPNGYTVPQRPGKYIKPSELEGAENRFRAVSPAIFGYQWFVDKQPTRVRMTDELPIADIPMKENGELDYSHFWTFVVWNYQHKVIQIMNITQSSIQKELAKYIRDEDYGDLRGYDFLISKTGSGFDTRYSTMVKPPKPIDPLIKQEFSKVSINLEALYDGDDPFAETSTEKVAEDAMNALS